MTAETLSHWLDGARGRANPEQFRFLQLVVDRVAAEYDLPNPGRPALSEPLRYLLHGGPGTGKSHALTLLKDLFDELGLKQGIDWDVLAYQNANAADLGGQTIHAAFGFSIAGPSADRPVSPEAAKRLAHYRWLFVDEISMVPANILGAMDQRLREVKADVDRFKLDSAGSPRPFGGVNVLASGDFTQLPPVSGGYLAEVPAHHARAPGEVPAQGRAAPPPLQELGRALLWDEFQGVVELKERERCKDAWWNEVTDQLRAGKLSEDNYKYLHGKEVEGCELAEEERASRRRVVQGPEDPRLREARFQEAPAVVATNDAKYQINKDRAKKFARDADGELFWSIARDVASSEVLKAEPCGRERKIRLLGETRGLIPVARWLQYHDKDTGGLLGTLPLAVGMRVALTQHLSDKALLAGEIGVVHSLVWQENRPRPDVVYVKFEGKEWQLEGTAEPGLYPVVPKGADWYLDRNKADKHKQVLRVRRTQLPLTPAYGMTAHFSQGKTLRAALVDLCVDKRVNQSYGVVTTTRVRSREDVLILRPFPLWLYQRGRHVGSELLLQQLRGETIDWAAYRDERRPCAVCQRCGHTKTLDYFSSEQWDRARANQPAMCLPCKNTDGRWKKRALGQNLERLPCVACEASKILDAFPRAQLEQPDAAAKRRCLRCLQTAVEELPCCRCGAALALDAFEPVMLTLPEGAAVCKACQAGLHSCQGCSGWFACQTCGLVLPLAAGRGEGQKRRCLNCSTRAARVTGEQTCRGCKRKFVDQGAAPDKRQRYCQKCRR